MEDSFIQVGEIALAWGKEHYHNASPEHHAVFANSVVYARLGFTGPYGGPSLREHVASDVLNSVLSFDWKSAQIEDVYSFLAPLAYGPLTEQHERAWSRMKDICYDDDPEDVRIFEAQRTHTMETTRLWLDTLNILRLLSAMTGSSIVELADRLAKEELTRLRYHQEK